MAEITFSLQPGLWTMNDSDMIGARPSCSLKVINTVAIFMDDHSATNVK